METAIQQLKISSPAFANKENIPSKYTCDGDEINPPLDILNIPDGTAAIAIIMEDPDAPNGTFDHWLVWNISAERHHLEENSNPGISGTNSAGKTGYHGPCPPSGAHRYYFTCYALDKKLDIMAGAGKEELKGAMQGHILAEGNIMGYYERKKS